MKKKIGKKDNRSIKTFFLYTFVVFFIILVSLSIKAVFIIRQSKFDGNNINVAVAKNGRVTAILGFNSNKNSTSFLKIKNGNIPVSSVGRTLGIIIDGKINSDSDLSSETSESILTKSLSGRESIKTDLTIFDLARLILFSKSVSGKDRLTEEIKHPMGEHEADKIIAAFFKDDNISSENLSIEIINATDEPGLGKRLERALTNVGANVVAVTTPHAPEALSRIEYFGSRSYTVDKLKKVLKFPAEKTDRKTIAKIVLVIGKDMQNTSVF